MDTLKMTLLSLGMLLLTACGEVEHVAESKTAAVDTKAVITGEDMEREAAEFLNSDEGNDYWDFSDPKKAVATLSD